MTKKVAKRLAGPGRERRSPASRARSCGSSKARSPASRSIALIVLELDGAREAGQRDVEAQRRRQRGVARQSDPLAERQPVDNRPGVRAEPGPAAAAEPPQRPIGAGPALLDAKGAARRLDNRAGGERNARNRRGRSPPAPAPRRRGCARTGSDPDGRGCRPAGRASRRDRPWRWSAGSDGSGRSARPTWPGATRSASAASGPAAASAGLARASEAISQATSRVESQRARAWSSAAARSSDLSVRIQSAASGRAAAVRPRPR